MRAVDLIRKKRDSGEHSREEIEFLVSGYTRGDIPDYQMAAWLMATWLRGLSLAETAALTEAMLHSGEVLDLSALAGKKVDKHSTGGVGDKTSLILAPIVAAGGLTVPMISGRGLGHTGGTLDKLESIPGFNTNLSLDQMTEIIRRCGFAMAGQTPRLVPADRVLYALRDHTGTVRAAVYVVAEVDQGRFVGWTLGQVSGDQVVHGLEPIQATVDVADGVDALAGGQAARGRDEVDHKRAT